MNQMSGGLGRRWADNGVFLAEDLSMCDGCAFNPSAPCAEDLDGDGIVGTPDVMLILSEFDVLLAVPTIWMVLFC